MNDSLLHVVQLQQITNNTKLLSGRNGNGTLGNRKNGNHTVASSHVLEPGNYHSYRKPSLKALSKHDMDAGRLTTVFCVVFCIGL